MKKYKLIKEYPLSPSLGEIWDEVRMNAEGLLRPDLEEEFWEEIEEKDYEILSFINTSNEVIFKRCKDGKFSNSIGLTGTLTKEFFLKNNHMPIHSIKRLSDGEVFTLGDELKHLQKDGISKIEVEKEGCETPWLKVNDGGISLRYAEHRTPLFTTEDGVDIYEGDKYWFYWTDHKTARGQVPFKIYGPFTESGEDSKCKNAKFFSTKKAAQDYIIWNKPVLSLQDISLYFPLICNPLSDKRHFLEQIIKDRI